MGQGQGIYSVLKIGFAEIRPGINGFNTHFVHQSLNFPSTNGQIRLLQFNYYYFIIKIKPVFVNTYVQIFGYHNLSFLLEVIPIRFHTTILSHLK
jgi:hypothetical protein